MNENKLFANKRIEQELDKENSKNLKEFYFKTLIESQLINSFVVRMEQLGFSENQINDFTDEVGNLDEQDRQALISSPWKLKQKYFEMKRGAIETGNVTMKDIVRDIVSKNQQFGRRFAYHASNEDIKPREVRDGTGQKSLEWVVNATEKDHRDEDLPRAYMSFDYEHLYRKKNPKYLYIVSYRVQQGSGFISNQPGNWGRSYGLDIIDKVDLKEIDEEMNNLMKEEQNKKNARAA